MSDHQESGNGTKMMIVFKTIAFTVSIIIMGLSAWMAAIQAAVNKHSEKISKVEISVAVQDTKMDEIIRRLYFIELKLDPENRNGFVPKPKNNGWPEKEKSK